MRQRNERPALMEDIGRAKADFEMTHAQELQKLAAWHRDFAETTDSRSERASRLRFAEYLERLAAESAAKEQGARIPLRLLPH